MLVFGAEAAGRLRLRGGLLFFSAVFGSVEVAFVSCGFALVSCGFAFDFCGSAFSSCASDFVSGGSGPNPKNAPGNWDGFRFVWGLR